MTNPSIILKDGNEIPEGIMDAFITTAAAFMILKRKKFRNRINLYCKTKNAWTR